MKKLLLLFYILSFYYCVGQNPNNNYISSQNDSCSCFVLNKYHIVNIQEQYKPENEQYWIHVTLTLDGVRLISALNEKETSYMYIESIPIKISILGYYINLFPEEPHIYGYDWDGNFFIDNDGFYICFSQSFLRHNSDFLSQLKNLNKH